MIDKFLKEIREKISCPQFGDDHYGEWGILNVNQRRTIKRLIDYMDGQEAYIKNQQAEIEDLNHSIDTLGRVKEQLKENLSKTEEKYQKEITRLDALLVCKNKVIRNLEKSFENAYDGAIKEFADRLKNIYIKDERYDRPDAHTLIDWLFNNIDNLVKEMVGDDK